jgi:uncharacterized protein with NAD-binding domain and iron-sulfur cluster
MSRPIKVAIIGGGCASITTAFELSRPALQGRYEVTVYQLGWRLGGKGASGRGPADRIEEHGLHLWMGFYENAFRLLRECYAELGPDPHTGQPADWRRAFEPDPFVGVMDHAPDGRWLPWVVQFPPAPGLPGDSDPAPPRWTVTDYLSRSITLLRTVIEAVRRRTGAPAAGAGRGADNPWAAPPPGRPEQIAEGISRLIRYGQLAGLGSILQALRWLSAAIEALPALPSALILQVHELIAGALTRQIAALTDRDDEVRRLWEIVDLVMAAVRGMVRAGLANDPRGFEAIDGYDCREWLKLNGASQRAVDSAFLRALYDLAFAYEDGDVTRPRIAAGQALRGALRAFFTYRGAFFWKMAAGMGDVVFAPFYQVLARRGVRFEFFHRLTNVVVSSGERGAEDKPHVTALEFDVQARIKGDCPYAPLYEVRGRPCWPSAPDWEQLQDGDRLREQGWQFESHWDHRRAGTRTLQVSRDFDLVVLGVGVGAIPHVAGELVAASPRWQTMVQRVKSVPTQAFQLWLSQDMHALGWTDGQINISGFVEPFDTWADMRQLIPEESFPSEVRAVAYFCNVLPDAASPDELADPAYPERRRQEVRNNIVRFLDRDIRQLWPRAVDGRGFRWDLLVDPDVPPPSRKPSEAPAGAARLDTQYWTANVNPSDRYSLSLPGSLVHRISPLDRSFDNLTVAGDWTDCGFNEGCVEAAVISGRLAAHAIAEVPALEDIVGYDHP